MTSEFQGGPTSYQVDAENDIDLGDHRGVEFKEKMSLLNFQEFQRSSRSCSSI